MTLVASALTLLTFHMTKLPIVRSGDRKAMLVATLCFVHCVAGPVLLSIAGCSSLAAASESFEPVFVVSSAVLGSATLIPAYRRKHRRCSCLLLFICGLFCLVVLRHLDGMIVPDAVLAGVGACLIVGAHAMNLKFLKSCECCRPEPARQTVKQPVRPWPKRTAGG